MLNLSGISHHQKRNSEASSTVGGGMPPVYGNNNNNNNTTQQLHHHHQNNNNNMSTISTGGTANSSETVFEDEVPVHLRNMDREEVVQDLGVCVQVIKNGPFRTVHIRVTDPKDPFFLFTMALAEDDYGRFKDKNELHVDFGGFPRDLVSMLVSSKNNSSGDNSHHNNNNNQSQINDMSTVSTSAGGTGGHTVLTFVIAGGDQATLRILERTRFRSVEHLSLVMNKQGDVGQKQYLAERFRFFFRSFQASENQRAQDNEGMGKQIHDLSIALDQTRADRDELRQQNAVQASEHKAELASTIDRLRATSEEQSRNNHSEHEGQIAALNKQHQQEQKRNQNEIDSLQNRLQQSAKEIHKLEEERLRLSTDLAQKTENLSSSTAEVKRLKDKVEELTSFKKSAQREKTELDLAAVASQERLKHMTDLLKNRDDEVSQLRRQADTNDSALRRSNEQLDSTRKKLDETEQSLSKAHHIIATHLQALKSAKEKQNSLLNQVQAAEKTANDKSMEYERVKLETSADREKTATLQSRVTELKEQLKRAEEQNSSLANDLKQSQEALLHLGRSSASSGVGVGSGSTRMYSASLGSHRASMSAMNMSTSAGNSNNTNNNENAYPSNSSNIGGLSSSTFAPAPMTLFKEFARNNNNSGESNNTSNVGLKSPSTNPAGGITGANNNNSYHISRYGGGGVGASNTTNTSSSNYTSYLRNNNNNSSSNTDPMSMLKSTASGGGSSGGNNAAGASSAYFPSS